MSIDEQIRVCVLEVFSKSIVAMFYKMKNCDTHLVMAKVNSNMSPDSENSSTLQKRGMVSDKMMQDLKAEPKTGASTPGSKGSFLGLLR